MQAGKRSEQRDEGADGRKGNRPTKQAVKQAAGSQASGRTGRHLIRRARRDRCNRIVVVYGESDAWKARGGCGKHTSGPTSEEEVLRMKLKQKE